MTFTFTERLIDSVKRRSLLYDPKHPDYKNVRMKEQVWKEIGAEFNKDGDELKKKWKNIRDCYQKHLRTINQKAGQVIKRSYKNWQWAQLMEFCRPQIEANMNDTEPNNVKTENESLPSPIFPVNEESLENIYDEGSATRRDCSSSYKRRRTDYASSRKYNIAVADATDLIFLGYSNTIKSFSLKSQAIVKMRIAQIIMEEELNNLDDISTVNRCATPPEVISFDNQHCLSNSDTEFSMKEEPDEDM